MDIVIREIMESDKQRNLEIDHSFLVDSILDIKFSNNAFWHTVKKVPSYTKKYESGRMVNDYTDYLNHPTQTIFFALVEGVVVGKIIIKEYWNNYAYIDFIIVDLQYRKFGIGRKLINEAKVWAKRHDMKGIMLETQNINVKACKFYESCGFKIGGVDQYLYKGLHNDTSEIALFYYLLFEKSSS